MSINCELLMEIAKSGSETSTIKLSKKLNLSQQTVSRLLIELEQKGIISRQSSKKGVRISLLEKGISMLRESYETLKDIFQKTSLHGEVRSGIGEGSYYVSLKQYQSQFKKLLGFEAFPGTLNIRVDMQDFLRFISAKDKIIIKGFQDKARTYGAIACYKTEIGSIESAIIIPERARHDESIAEVISPINLRSRLKLKENSKVELK